MYCPSLLWCVAEFTTRLISECRQETNFIIRDDLDKQILGYCKIPKLSRDFFYFANNVERHIHDVTYSQLGHYLPISISNRVISPFREGSILKIKPRESFRIYSMICMFM